MTDEMRAREEAICKVAKVNSIGEVSDGFHTFNGLYEQRMILFATLVKAYKDKAWKSYRHEDGEYCFGGGWFVVGIDTPEGSYTYHYENKYWDMFDCVELPRAKHWDGHTEADAETRLMSLKPEPHWIPVTERLPENETNVLITVECRPIGRKPYRRVVRAFHEDGTWSDMRSAYSWDDDSWDEYTDDDGNVLIPEGWFEAIDYHGEFCGVDDFVLAWMPLPEPYKGVTNGRD